MDDDDEWLSNRLEDMVKEYNKLDKIKKEKICVIQCGNETIDSKGKLVGYYLPQNCGNLKESIKKIGAKTPSSAFLFKKDILKKVGEFSEDLISGIDHDIWMKLAINDCYNLCIKKSLVRIYKEPIITMMTNTDKRIKGIKQYVNKWENTYIEWFGKEKAIEHKKEYFSNVISGLVAEKILTKNYKEAVKAYKEIVKYNDSSLQSLKYLKGVFVAILREKLSYELKQKIKQLRFLDA